MLNQVTVIGRLGNEPEIRVIPNSNKKCATLSICSWENYFDQQKNEWQQIPEWHRVVMFSENLDHVEKWEKGSILLVNGKLKTRSYESNGQTKYTTEIHGSVKLISKPGEKQPHTAQQATQQQNQVTGAPTPPEQSDLPF